MVGKCIEFIFCRDRTPHEITNSDEWFWQTHLWFFSWVNDLLLHSRLDHICHDSKKSLNNKDERQHNFTNDQMETLANIAKSNGSLTQRIIHQRTHTPT